jgi:hypothetical protein
MQESSVPGKERQEEKKRKDNDKCIVCQQVTHGFVTSNPKNARTIKEIRRLSHHIPIHLMQSV